MSDESRILHADGNPIEKPEPFIQRCRRHGKAIGLAAIAFVATVAATIGNLERIKSFIVAPQPKDAGDGRPAIQQDDDFSIAVTVMVKQFGVAENNASTPANVPQPVVVLRATIVNTSEHDIFLLGIAATIVGDDPGSGQPVGLSFLPSTNTSSTDKLTPGQPRDYDFHLVRPRQIKTLLAHRGSCLITCETSRGLRKSIMPSSLAARFSEFEEVDNITEESLQTTVADVIVDNAGIVDGDTADIVLLTVHSSHDPRTSPVFDDEEEAIRFLKSLR